MPRHLRAVRSIAFTALLIALLTLLGFVLLRRPYYPALPSPNGYDDFVRGGKAVVGDVSSYRDLDLVGLQDMISSNAEPLRLVRLGLTRQCSFPTELGITNFSATIPDMPGLKKLALVLRAEGKLAEMENRPGDAAKDYVEGLRFGNETCRGGLLINRLIGIACEAIAGVPLAKMVHSLDRENARAVLLELDKFDQGRITFDEVNRNERRFALHEIPKQHNPLDWVKSWLEARSLIQHSEARHNAVVAHERLIMVELALCCYKSDHGRAPTSLEQLVPNYLSRVPQDPFNGQPLIYRDLSTNWLVYSVGTGGIDQGGKPGGGRFGNGNLLYDSAW